MVKRACVVLFGLSALTACAGILGFERLSEEGAPETGPQTEASIPDAEAGSDAPSDPKYVVEQFKQRFVDTKIFWHRQHANQFSNYLVNRHDNGPDPRFTRDTASKLVEEANLFIDAAHQAHAAWQQKLNVLKEPAAAAANPLVTA
jgi:hypothetical protein